MTLIKEAVKNLKLLFGGAGASSEFVMTSSDKFPPVLSVKEALDAVIGKVLTLTTTDDTETEMTVFKSGNALAMAQLESGQVLGFRLTIVGRQTAGSGGTVGDCGYYVITGAIKRIGNTTAIVGSVVAATPIEDNSAWAVAVAADDTNEALSVKVTGVADCTIKWRAYLEYVAV